MVRVGSARSNEHGGITGGKPGDQKSGAEVSVQAWYLHSKGWIVIRAKDPTAREKIATNMEAGCRNNHIGYCQTHRTTATAAAKPFGYDLSKITKEVETDCSELVRVCCLYAGIQVGCFSTGNEVAALQATGHFEVLRDAKYCSSSEFLMRGDILVTKTKGHTVVVLDNGDNVLPEPEKKSGWRQEAGKWRYYHGNTGEPICNDWHRDPDGRWYWFDGTGDMVVNTWKKSKNKWYYLGFDGAMVTNRLLQINSEIFAFGPNGEMLEGTFTIKTNARGAIEL